MFIALNKYFYVILIQQKERETYLEKCNAHFTGSNIKEKLKFQSDGYCIDTEKVYNRKASTLFSLLRGFYVIGSLVNAYSELRTPCYFSQPSEETRKALSAKDKRQRYVRTSRMNVRLKKRDAVKEDSERRLHAILFERRTNLSGMKIRHEAPRR